MKAKNLNASSIKTKTLIRNTFMKMLKEKREIRKISVSELVKRANINRTTFYAHYSDLYEIGDELETETIAALFGNHHIQNIEDVNMFFSDMFKYFERNADIYQMLLASDETLLFLGKLRRMAKKKLGEELSSIPDFANEPFLDLRISLYVDGMAELYIEYFRGQSQYSLDMISKGLLDVLSAILPQIKHTSN